MAIDLDIAVVDDVTIDIKSTIVDSLKEVEAIRNGELPKRSYKEMMNRIRENLKENK